MRELFYRIKKYITDNFYFDGISLAFIIITGLCFITSVFLQHSPKLITPSTKYVPDLFGVIGLITLILFYLRGTKKKNYSSYAKNGKFNQFYNRILNIFQKSDIDDKITQFRKYHIFKCPSCRQKIRIPRGKGKIAITCPKCRKEFIRRS